MLIEKIHRMYSYNVFSHNDGIALVGQDACARLVANGLLDSHGGNYQLSLTGVLSALRDNIEHRGYNTDNIDELYVLWQVSRTITHMIDDKHMETLLKGVSYGLVGYALVKQVVPKFYHKRATSKGYIVDNRLTNKGWKELRKCIS